VRFGSTKSDSAPGFHQMVLEFPRQLQQMSSFNGAPRPFNQRAVLIEMGNSTWTLRARSRQRMKSALKLIIT